MRYAIANYNGRLAYIPQQAQALARRQTRVGFSSFGSLGGDNLGGGSCGCNGDSSLAGGVGAEGLVNTHPFLALAGAFLLGYLLKGR